MYKKCLIFVGRVIFNIMSNNCIYPPTDGYMKNRGGAAGGDVDRRRAEEGARDRRG